MIAITVAFAGTLFIVVQQLNKDLDGTVQMQVGDQLQCSPGQVTISHAASDNLMHTTTFE